MSWFEDGEDKWLTRAKIMNLGLTNRLKAWEVEIGDSVLYINELRRFVLDHEQKRKEIEEEKAEEAGA